MSDNGMSKRDEVEMLLPFYESGDLDGEELAIVENWLADNPEGQAALEAVRAERSAVGAANDNIVPPADALQRFDQALDRAIVAPQVTPHKNAPIAGNWLERLLPAWLIPAPATAMALSALLVAALVGQTIYYGSGSGDIELASEKGAAPEGTRLIIVFEPDATMDAISAALKQADAIIVSGPKAAGLYEVVVRDRGTATLESRIDALSKDASVQLVQPLKQDETR